MIKQNIKKICTLVLVGLIGFSVFGSTVIEANTNLETANSSITYRPKKYKNFILTVPASVTFTKSNAVSVMRKIALSKADGSKFTRETDNNFTLQVLVQSENKGCLELGKKQGDVCTVKYGMKNTHDSDRTEIKGADWKPKPEYNPIAFFPKYNSNAPDKNNVNALVRDIEFWVLQADRDKAESFAPGTILKDNLTFSVNTERVDKVDIKYNNVTPSE